MYLHSTLRGYCSQSVSANKVSQLNSQRYVVHWDHFKSERQLQDVCSNSRYTLSPKVIPQMWQKKGELFKREEGRRGRESWGLTRLEDFLRSSDMRCEEEHEGNPPPPERERWCPGTLRELCLARGWVGERGTALPGLQGDNKHMVGGSSRVTMSIIR